MADANKYYIQVIRGALQWHYRVMATNGQVLSQSQRYFSKSNCLRAARKLSKELGFKVMGEF